MRNAFIIQKDSAGYNQIKGRDILGKFVDNDLQDVNVVGNGEVIQYVRNDTDNSLIGINKTTCSSINFTLKNGELQTTTFLTMPEGATYPPSQFPDNVRLLRGFVWREKEKPLTKDDIFIKDDTIIEPAAADPNQKMIDEEAAMKAKFAKILKEDKKKKEN